MNSGIWLGSNHLLSVLCAELSLKYVRTGVVQTGPGPLVHFANSHVNPIQVGAAVQASSACTVV